MANEFAGKPAHSAEYFGDARNYWWNDDFLALCLQRWLASGIRRVLDVGCGVGHWSRAWARVMPPEVEFDGVDREPAWVEKAREAAAQAGLAARCRFAKGVAEALPFPDNNFDFVTCQTLLIHVKDARAVVAEMIRVAAPGGLVVVAEPNNAANHVLEDALAAELSPSDSADLVRFNLTCLRGKAALGLGDETVGQVMPAYFRQAGLESISVCLNEKSCPMVPPYDSPRERALLEEMADWEKRELWIWSRADTSRYFLAGGGQEPEFSSLLSLALSTRKKVGAAARAGKFASAGGAIFYLVAGRKKLVMG